MKTLLPTIMSLGLAVGLTISLPTVVHSEGAQISPPSSAGGGTQKQRCDGLKKDLKAAQKAKDAKKENKIKRKMAWNNCPRS